jgi:hypothetical protein
MGSSSTIKIFTFFCGSVEITLSIMGCLDYYFEVKQPWPAGILTPAGVNIIR